MLNTPTTHKDSLGVRLWARCICGATGSLASNPGADFADVVVAGAAFANVVVAGTAFADAFGVHAITAVCHCCGFLHLTHDAWLLGRKQPP